MIIINHSKKLILFILSFLLWSKNLQAQDSLKISAKNRINWLVALAKLTDIEDVIDSINAKDYKLIYQNLASGNEAGLTLIYRIALHKETCGLISKDGDEVTACFYETYDKPTYIEMYDLIQIMGFKPTDVYNGAADDMAYSRDNSLLVLKTQKTKDRTSYMFVASKLKM